MHKFYPAHYALKFPASSRINRFNPGIFALGLLLAAGLAGLGAEAGQVFATAGLLNVRDFGAVGDGHTDDTAALQAALADQSGRPDAAGLYFPPGQYCFSKPFRSVRHLHLAGAGFDWGTGTILTFTGSNQPVIEIEGCGNCIENLAVTYSRYQDARSNPHSACLQFNDGAYLNTVRCVAVRGGAYGLFNPPENTAWQNRIETLWVQGYSISGVAVETGGSTWTWSNVYIQNTTGPANPRVAIEAYAYAGRELVLRLPRERVPSYVREGLFVVLEAMSDASLNGTYAIGRMTAADGDYLLQLHTSSALAGIRGGRGKINFQQQPPVAGYPCRLTGDHDISGLDVEHAVTVQSAFLEVAGSGAVNISHLHFESLYSTRPVFCLVHNEAPALKIETMTLMNLGFRRNSSAACFSALKGTAVLVGNLHMRDVMHDGSSWVIQHMNPADAAVRVGGLSTLGTLRADAAADLDGNGMAQLFGLD